MPSWRTHWAVARLLGYQPDPRVEELIDSKPLHDLGVSIVRKPLPGGVSRRRAKAYKRAEKALAYLAEKPDLFYLHHVLDGLVERLASSILIGEPLRPERILEAEKLDALYIRSRILDSRIVGDFPQPPEELFERLRSKWYRVLELLESDAKRVLTGRSRREAKPLEELVQENVRSILKRVEAYYRGLLSLWHPEKALSMARSYARGVLAYHLALEAAERSRLLDYLLVYGASRRKVYEKLLVLAEGGYLLPLLFPISTPPSREELKRLEEASVGFKTLYEKLLDIAEELVSKRLGENRQPSEE